MRTCGTCMQSGELITLFRGIWLRNKGDSMCSRQMCTTFTRWTRCAGITSWSSTSLLIRPTMNSETSTALKIKHHRMFRGSTGFMYEHADNVPPSIDWRLSRLSRIRATVVHFWTSFYACYGLIFMSTHCMYTESSQVAVGHSQPLWDLGGSTKLKPVNYYPCLSKSWLIATRIMRAAMGDSWKMHMNSSRDREASQQSWHIHMERGMQQNISFYSCINKQNKIQLIYSYQCFFLL